MTVIGCVLQQEMPIPQGFRKFHIFKDRAAVPQLAERLDHLLELQVRILLTT
jgi:hypothetical protein